MLQVGIITNYKDNVITYDRSSASFKTLNQTYHSNDHEIAHSESETTPMLFRKSTPMKRKSGIVRAIVKSRDHNFTHLVLSQRQKYWCPLGKHFYFKCAYFICMLKLSAYFSH